MSYLRRFPIDKLKIDKTFVAGMDTHSDDASIVQAIISLAHGLRLKVIAEGVETAQQLASLKAMGCDQYQGYYCSPALPAADFEQLLREQGAATADTVIADMDETSSKLAKVRALARARK
jgi:EAL domain-containing protein (putative c-di-GMP-specific phosphodiesterase class I)